MAKLTPQQLTAAAARAGREAEERLLREMTTEGSPMHDLIHHGYYRTRDAAFSYPPSPEGRLGGGGPEWRGESFPGNNDPDPHRGRPLPPPGTLSNPFTLGPNRPVEAVMPFQYGERDFRRSGRDLGPSLSAHLSGPSFGSGFHAPSPQPPRDVSGYITPVRPGDFDDPDLQGLGYQRRDPGDFDTADDADPIGWLANEHRGPEEDYHIAHDPSTGDCAIFRRGQDRPIGRRPAPGMSASDYRITRDRRSGRLMVARRRRGDRMRQLRHEADRIRNSPTRDAAHREHQALANLDRQHAEFWRRPQSPSDFWGRR
jgi:hypothetical protein